MKFAELARPGLLVLGIAATALLGFAAGVAVSRDPEAVRRTTRRVARAAALGLERATLLAAQAREHIGDLWVVKPGPSAGLRILFAPSHKEPHGPHHPP